MAEYKTPLQESIAYVMEKHKEVRTAEVEALKQQRAENPELTFNVHATSSLDDLTFPERNLAEEGETLEMTAESIPNRLKQIVEGLQREWGQYEKLLGDITKTLPQEPERAKPLLEHYESQMQLQRYLGDMYFPDNFLADYYKENLTKLYEEVQKNPKQFIRGLEGNYTGSLDQVIERLVEKAIHTRPDSFNARSVLKSVPNLVAEHMEGAVLQTGLLGALRGLLRSKNNGKVATPAQVAVQEQTVAPEVVAEATNGVMEEKVASIKAKLQGQAQNTGEAAAQKVDPEVAKGLSNIVQSLQATKGNAEPEAVEEAEEVVAEVVGGKPEIIQPINVEPKVVEPEVVEAKKVEVTPEAEKVAEEVAKDQSKSKAIIDMRAKISVLREQAEENAQKGVSTSRAMLHDRINLRLNLVRAEVEDSLTRPARTVVLGGEASQSYYPLGKETAKYFPKFDGEMSAEKLERLRDGLAVMHPELNKNFHRYIDDFEGVFQGDAIGAVRKMVHDAAHTQMSQAASDTTLTSVKKLLNSPAGSYSKRMEDVANAVESKLTEAGAASKENTEKVVEEAAEKATGWASRFGKKEALVVGGVAAAALAGIGVYRHLVHQSRATTSQDLGQGM